MGRRALVLLAALFGVVLAGGTAVAAPGEVGALHNCPSAAARDIGQGDSGAYVRRVQCLLNWAINPSTYHHIAEDGVFGPDTRGKVVKFQQCANALGAGLAVDGRVGSKTAPHLEWWAQHTAYIC
ncbi:MULTISPECIES: peptidoglycan-binding protein [Actinosynnema]|uniref:peptidoglycan-binding domain-containing protein n=1 Tax=Actinosynnema TaxID=40566 RepID=UPI0020A2E12F|nr:peptidoglycan-binding domain-containing protein [Actinosynnema pretiosum]MCP2097159.1 putative peptidoglycan binding domain-containing protein [Actinosynnema pretiosum]